MKTTDQDQRNLTGSPRMNLVPLLWLAAVLAAPLNAQVCSGGAGGGMDATGNQCSDAAAIASHTDGPAIAAPQSTAARTASTSRAPAKFTPLNFAGAVSKSEPSRTARQPAPSKLANPAAAALEARPASEAPRECNLRQGIDSDCVFN